MPRFDNRDLVKYSRIGDETWYRSEHEGQVVFLGVTDQACREAERLFSLDPPQLLKAWIVYKAEQGQQPSALELISVATLYEPRFQRFLEQRSGPDRST